MHLLESLTISDLKKAIALRERIDALQSELGSLLDGTDAHAPSAARGHGLSAKGRAAIIAAQKARWAKVKGMKLGETKPKGRRTVSAATRKAMAAAAKARWAKAKAAGRTRL
jgi:hypothetical protein